MAVITLSEVKVLLQISGTSKDTLINALIPIIQDDVIVYCNYGFGTDLDPVAEDWPEGIKLPVAEMIGYTMASMSGGGASIGMQSETQGGYSYSRGTGAEVKGESGYPVGTEKKLNKWRRVSVKNTQIMSQFRDRRLLTLKQLANDVVIYDTPKIPIELEPL